MGSDADVQLAVLCERIDGQAREIRDLRNELAKLKDGTATTAQVEAVSSKVQAVTTLAMRALIFLGSSAVLYVTAAALRGGVNVP